MTQELFFFFQKHDSKNWTLCQKKIQRIELFLNMTQRIEPFFFEYDSKNCSFFSKMTQKFELSFRKNVSKNWIWLKWFIFFEKINQIMELFFMSQRIELCLKFDSRTVFFQKHDSKNWTLFLLWLKRIEPVLCMTQR